MAASKKAFFLQEPDPTRAESGMWPENPPALLWGQGDPAAIEPFTRVNKGSIYANVNKTDDLPAVWMKVDEGGDAADRALLITSAFLLWNEATGASGAAEGDITIGTASAGAQIVAATTYAVSKATGSIQSLSLVAGAVAAPA